MSHESDVDKGQQKRFQGFIQYKTDAVEIIVKVQ